MLIHEVDIHYDGAAISHYHLAHLLNLSNISKVTAYSYALRRGYRIQLATIQEINRYFEPYHDP